MIDERTLCGYPIFFQKNSYIYPPKVKDYLENKGKFLTYLRILEIDQIDIDKIFKKEIEEGIKTPNPYYFMYKNYCLNEEIKKITLEAFEFFLHEPVTFIEDRAIILVGNLEEVITNAKSSDDFCIIDEKNFPFFQNLIRISVGDKPLEIKEVDENEDPRVTRLKKRFKKYEKEVAEIKARKGEALEFSTCLTAICCMGIGLNPLNIGELSYAAVPVLLAIYQEKEKYDIDIRSLLAGADSKKVKPKYWIRNLDD